MSAAAEALTQLKRELGELKDLGRIAALLAWDQQVMMPPLGAAARADQLSTLGRLMHERATSPELGKLLDAAEPLGELFPEFSHPRNPEFLLTLPHVHRTSGFFIARLRVR